MKLTKKNLDAAVDNNIINRDQADHLFEFLTVQSENEPSFNFTHVLYYFGGLIAIGAMTLFMNLGWEAFGGYGILIISLLYAAVGFILMLLFDEKGHKIPAGICVTFVVALTPLAIYGLQKGIGFWPEGSEYRDYHYYIKWHWIYMELGTLVVGAVIAWRTKYPFSLMPIAVTLWYMSMDVAVMVVADRSEFEFRSMISMYFGLLMTMLAFWVDIRARKTADYAFWLYIFGVLAFWGGMTAQNSDSEVSKFIYFCINIFMIGIGVLLVRRIFVILGAFGSCFYLEHLASSIFKNSWLFPISLTAIGLLIIYLGVLWQKNEKTVTQNARNLLPTQLRELLESK